MSQEQESIALKLRCQTRILNSFDLLKMLIRGDMALGAAGYASIEEAARNIVTTTVRENEADIKRFEKKFPN